MNNYTTRMNYLYKHIVYDYDTCVKYLSDRDLLPSQTVCDGSAAAAAAAADGAVCGGELREYTKKEKKRDSNGHVVRTVCLRCTNDRCQTVHSIRKKNPFHVQCDGEIGLCKIVELVWYWVAMIPVTQTRLLTGRRRATVVKWYDACRDVCQAQYEKRGKMGGAGQTVQVDECLFRARRKDGRGRVGELPAAAAAAAAAAADAEDDDENPERNYGQRVHGPWVLGLCWNRPDNVSEVRYFVVDKRDGATLMRIIADEVAAGTTVRTDQWAAYKCLAREGYVHDTVKPQQYFVGPCARAHTMDGLWRMLRKRYKIKSRTESSQLDRQLVEEWWRCVNRNNDKSTFQRFWEDVNATYSRL